MQKQKGKCVGCNKVFATRHQVKYCSNKCQGNHKFNIFLEKWKNGFLSGTIGIRTKTISAHLRRYLLEKYKEKCSLCGWSRRHIVTGSVPLEIDHIDGNAENNLENNLRLICPNCHALTIHFRNLNRGKGRAWRLKKGSTL